MNYNLSQKFVMVRLNISTMATMVIVLGQLLCVFPPSKSSFMLKKSETIQKNNISVL